MRWLPAIILLTTLVALGLSVGAPGTALHAAPQSAAEHASADVRIGDVSSIASDPNDPVIFYAVAAGRGIFKSTDGAETWKLVRPDITPGTIYRKIVVDPKKSGVVYVQGDTNIFKTTDGGASWTPMAVDLDGNLLHALAINPADPSILYLTSAHNIFQSTDGGETWRPIASDLKSAPFRLLIDPRHPKTLYGVCDDRLIKTEDGGVHWTKIHTGVPPNDMTSIVMSPVDSSVLYLGTAEHGIYRSNNGGKSWSSENSGLTTKDPNTGKGELARVWSIAIDPSNPATMYAGGSAYDMAAIAVIFKSTDSGKSWQLTQAIGRVRGSSGAHSLLIDASDHNVLLAGGDYDGIYRSTDAGENWSSDDSALSTGDIVAFDLGRSDGAFYAATKGGVLRFEGNRWRQVGFLVRDFKNEVPQSVAVDPTNSATVYVGTGSSYDRSYSGLFKTTDGGRTWSDISAGLPTALGAVSTLLIDPSDPSTVYVGMFSSGWTLTPAEAKAEEYMEKHNILHDMVITDANDPSLESAIYKSTDGGQHWKPQVSGVVRHDMSVESLFFEPQDASTLYAMTGGSVWPSAGLVWRSADAGDHWTRLDALPSSNVFAIAPSNPSLMYAAQSLTQRDQHAESFLLSMDAGLTWLPMGNTGQLHTKVLAVDPRDPMTLYADNGLEGIRKSTDGGRTWTISNSGLPRASPTPLGVQPPTRVTALTIDPNHPDTIYIGTSGRGVFESTDDGVTWHSKPTN